MHARTVSCARMPIRTLRTTLHRAAPHRTTLTPHGWRATVEASLSVFEGDTAMSVVRSTFRHQFVSALAAASIVATLLAGAALAAPSNKPYRVDIGAGFRGRRFSSDVHGDDLQ